MTVRFLNTQRGNIKTICALFALAFLLTSVDVVQAQSKIPEKPKPASPPAVEPDITKIATDKIADLSASLVVVDAETNVDELEKIGGSFRNTYRFKRLDITYKQPNKTRLEAKVIGIPVILIFDGDKRLSKAAFRKDSADLTGQPGQKQSLMQLGVFAKDWMVSDWKPIFLRREGGYLIYDLRMQNTNNKSHEMIWVDGTKSLIVKRQSFTGDDKLRMTTKYLLPKQVRPGIWLPSKVEVYNQFGKRGGTQVFENVKVNQGISDTVFHL